MKRLPITKWIEDYTIMTLVYYPDANLWGVLDANVDDDRQPRYDAQQLTLRLNRTDAYIYREKNQRIYIKYDDSKIHATPLEAIAYNDFDLLLLPIQLRQQLITIRVAQELEGNQ